MTVDVLTLCLLGGCSVLAGFIDSIAGGGGLLTIPALLSAGIPPTHALATNKLQSSFGSFSSSLYFIRRGYVDLRMLRHAILCTALGSMIGSLLIQQLNSSALAQVIPFMLLGFAAYFLFSPNISDQDRKARLNFLYISIGAGLTIGFYDGFFGPGTGSFFAITFVALAGFSLSKATAYSKVLNFVSNITALMFFLLGGKIIWQVGLVMGIGQFIGARLGSRMVVAKGSKLIRPLLVTMSIVMSVRLLWQHYSS